MATAVQVRINGHDAGVTRDMPRAFQRIARSMFPGSDGHYLKLADADEYPQLHASGAEVSYCHRVRYEAEARDYELVEVITHDLDAEPGYITDVFHYDLISDFDPSYLVSKHLFTASATDEDLGELAAALEAEVEEGLAKDGYKFKTDARCAEYVERLRAIQREFGGPEVIPATGKPRDIIQTLPYVARAKFEDIVARAYPEEVAGAKP